MKTNKRVASVLLALVIVTITVAHPPQLPAQTAEAKSSSSGTSSTAAQWSVQVDKVDPGGVALAPSFQIAIYESLLDELNKTKRFKQVLRDGDRNAGDVSDLLILKTTVQKYTAGSETRRAVTTISGATKLTVRSQLCARDGHIVLERTVNGTSALWETTCELPITWPAMWPRPSSKHLCRTPRTRLRIQQTTRIRLL